METIRLWNSNVFCPLPGGQDPQDFQPYMERWTIDDGVKRGAVVVFPGGGYSHRAPHEGGVVAQKFNELGFHAFVVQYRIAPNAFPAGIQDAFRAIRLIRAKAEQWNVISDQIATLGFSAGGHLCACTGTLYSEIQAEAGDEADRFSQKPDALILCYPVINVNTAFGHIGSGKMLFGPDFEPGTRLAYDLESRVNAETPPSFLWHTADDGGVNVRNSLAFAQAAWNHQVTCALHVYPHGSHGLGLAEKNPDVAGWPHLAADFLTQSAGFTQKK